MKYLNGVTIGSVLSVNGIIDQVSELTLNGIVFFKSGNVKVEDVNAIKLDANNFACLIYNDKFKELGFNLSVMVVDTEGVFICYGVEKIKIKYVHDFQTLWELLTGEMPDYQVF